MWGWLSSHGNDNWLEGKAYGLASPFEQRKMVARQSLGAWLSHQGIDKRSQG